MASQSTVIHTTSEKVFHLKIVCWNIANSVRDQGDYSLIERLPKIISTLKEIRFNDGIDLLILLEANRPSLDLKQSRHTFTSIANQIQTDTDLTYLGVDVNNASGYMSFGKAIFYNPDTIFVNKCAQLRTTTIGFGSSVTHLTVWPVESSKIIINKPLQLGFVLFPLPFDQRMEAIDWLKNNKKFDVIMGDFNSFATSFDQMVKKIEEIGYENCLPHDTQYTFQAFSCDVITVNQKELELMPNSILIQRLKNDEIKIRPVSWLDHCFHLKSSDSSNHLKCLKCEAKVIDIFNFDSLDIIPPSDHCPIFCNILI